MNMVNMNADNSNQSSEAFVNNSSFLHNKLNSLNEQMNKDNVFATNKMLLNNNSNFSNSYSNHSQDKLDNPEYA